MRERKSVKYSELNVRTLNVPHIFFWLGTAEWGIESNLFTAKQVSVVPIFAMY